MMGKKRLHTCTRCSYSTESSQKIQFHIHANRNSDIVYCHSCHYSACTPLILAAHRRLKHDDQSNKKHNKLSFNTKVALAKRRFAVIKPSRVTLTKPRYGVTKSRLALAKPRIAITNRMLKSTQPMVAITHPLISTPARPKSANSKVQKDEALKKGENNSLPKPNSSGKVSFRTAAVALNSIGDWINEEKPFKCSYCTYRSDSMGDVQTHIRVHQTLKKLPRGSGSPTNNNNYYYSGTEQNSRDSSPENSSESVQDASDSDQEYDSSSNDTHLEKTEDYYSGSFGMSNIGAVNRPGGMQDTAVNRNPEISQDPSTMEGVPETLVVIQDGNRIFRCSYCPYSNRKRHRVKEHGRIHTGERPFACDQCDYRASWSSNLRQHKLRHSRPDPVDSEHNDTLSLEQKYSCSYCSYRCFTKQNLQRHENSHLKKNLIPLRLKMGPEPLVSLCKRSFACSFCDQRFYTKQNLRIHEQVMKHDTSSTHTVSRMIKPKISQFTTSKIAGTKDLEIRERPFPCSFCAHRSFRKQDLRKHELIHVRLS